MWSAARELVGSLFFTRELNGFEAFQQADGSTSRRSVSGCAPARTSVPTAHSTSYLTKSSHILGYRLHGREGGPRPEWLDRAAPSRLLAASIAALLFSGVLLRRGGDEVLAWVLMGASVVPLLYLVLTWRRR